MVAYVNTSSIANTIYIHSFIEGATGFNRFAWKVAVKMVCVLYDLAAQIRDFADQTKEHNIT